MSAPVTVQASDRRPLGVLVVAIVQLVRALLIALQLLEIQLLPDGHPFELSFQIPRPAAGTLELYIAQAIGLGLIVASVAFAVGLYTGRRWGWVGAIVTSGVSLAVSIAAWWYHDPTYAAMLLNVVAVFYLNQRDVRTFFGELRTEARGDV